MYRVIRLFLGSPNREMVKTRIIGLVKRGKRIVQPLRKIKRWRRRK